jgi:hypothetical protein
MTIKTLTTQLEKQQSGVCVFALILALLVFGATVGCGGGAGSMPTNAVPAGASITRVNITDAPSDRVVSFEVTVGPITLTATDNSSVTVLSGTRHVEISHLSGTSEPLVIANIPSGSYTSASVTVSQPEVTFVNSSGVMSQFDPVLNQKVTLNFVPAISINSAASVVTLDVNVAKSLTFDSAGNIVAVSFGSSSFTAMTSAVAPQQEQEAENGELEDITGKVSGVNGTSFTVDLGQNGPSLTFSTDANTEFKDGATLATIMNMIVKVEGTTNPDGTLYAKEVEGIENESGSEVAGVVSRVQGAPANSLSIVVQDGQGSGITDSLIGSSVTADVAGASYEVDTGNMDSSGLGSIPGSPNFPFDGSTIHAGQRVEVQNISAENGTSTSAATVELKQQALVGTVSGLNAPSAPTTFTLTVPSDSAFAMFSGSDTLTVFWQPGTDVSNLPQGLKSGQTVRIRGLVFFTGTAFNMVARRIDQ